MPKTSTNKNELAEFVGAKFKKLSDPSKAVEMAAYMKTEMPFYGVQKPDRLPIYKEMRKRFAPESRKDYERNVLALWNQRHREEKYAALEYACYFDDFITFDSVPLYERLIREGAWWDFVDVLAQHLVGRVLLKERKMMKPVINEWVDDEDMWIRRSALLSHNRHKQQTDEKQLFSHCLKRAGEQEFFIRKAIGWALREYSYAQPSAVKKFLETNKTKLSPLSIREGAKHLERNLKG